MNRPTGEPRKSTWPWDVYKAGDGNAPANPVRYEHSTKVVIAMFVVVILVAVLASSARTVETDMLADARAAKEAGFPQLPPGHASSARIAEFIEKWNLNAPGSPPRRDIDALSLRVGDYEIDSSLYNLGITSGFLAVLFFSAVAYSRALNNLRALGHEVAVLAAAWAFASWFVPIMNFIVPWRIVARTLHHAWSGGDSSSTSGGSGAKWAVVFAGTWGVVWIGFLFLNPLSISFLMGSGDIDERIRQLAAYDLMMLYLPVLMAVNAAVLAMISYRQRKRYRLLDAASRGGG